MPTPTTASTRPAPLLRPYTEADWPALWPILAATNAAGDTFAFAPDMPETEVRAAWTAPPRDVTVACDAATGALLGSSYLKPNQPGLGDHVANAGYVVAPAARGRGVAAALCAHSIERARALGYRAMQFNLVVATNTRALALWEGMGFHRVGVLEGAFRHAALGEVDAVVMYRRLVPVGG